MTPVLDPGGVSWLTVGTARLAGVRRRYGWPALVPSVVLTEALTGDHRRDQAVNRFPHDLAALAAHADRRIVVVRV